MKKLAVLILLASLVSCSEQADSSVPTQAQKQIDEYTNKLKMCTSTKDSGQTTTNSTEKFTTAELNDQTITEDINPPQSLDSNSEAKKVDFPSSGVSNPEAAEAASSLTQQIGLQQISAFQESDIVLGNLNSKIVVIEYFSLTCSHCSYFHRNIYPDFKKKYIDTNLIAFVQREFVGTRQDLEASVLARCAGKTQRLKFYDVLLHQQDSWAFNRNYHEVLTNIGQIGGITPANFTTCLNDKEILEVLQNNAQAMARTPGFNGTPAFIINDKLYNGRFSLEGLSEYIDNLSKTVK